MRAAGEFDGAPEAILTIGKARDGSGRINEPAVGSGGEEIGARMVGFPLAGSGLREEDGFLLSQGIGGFALALYGFELGGVLLDGAARRA